MKIVVKNVNENPKVVEIGGSLEELQSIVGGYIEAFSITEDIMCICNERGKILNLPINFRYDYDFIQGNVFFASDGINDFESLNDKQISLLMKVFNAIM